MLFVFDIVWIRCLLFLIVVPIAAVVGGRDARNVAFVAAPHSKRRAASFGVKYPDIKRSIVTPSYENSHCRATVPSQLHVVGDDVGADELLVLNNDGFMLDSVNLTELSLLPNLKPLRDAIDAKPPTDLKAFLLPVKVPLPESLLPSSACYTFNYDIGHAGRFTLFGSGGGSVDANAVIERELPLDYIQNYLAYEDEFPSHPDEVVVFSPGLNTLHEPAGLQRTSPMRIAHYSRILEIGIAQLHTGTQLDQGDLTVYPVSSDLATILREKKLFPDEEVDRLEDFGWEIKANKRDTIQTVLSSRNLVDTPIKDSIKKLLDVAADNVLNGGSRRSNQNQPHLVLMSYSRATIETASALQSWKEEAQERLGYSKEQIEDLMRKAFTIVTIGCASRSYPDGPAYIHVSMLEDRLTKGLGAMEGRSGGGRDAVYIHANSPYATSDESNDAHNMGACVGQLLATAMRLCDTRSFRELYDSYSREVIANKEINVTKITAAMIQATKGSEWLWFPEASFKGMPPLPTEDEARSVLDLAFGRGAYDEIAETNEGGMQQIIDEFQVDARVSQAIEAEKATALVELEEEDDIDDEELVLSPDVTSAVIEDDTQHEDTPEIDDSAEELVEVIESEVQSHDTSGTIAAPTESVQPDDSMTAAVEQQEETEDNDLPIDDQALTGKDEEDVPDETDVMNQVAGGTEESLAVSVVEENASELASVDDSAEASAIPNEESIVGEEVDKNDPLEEVGSVPEVELNELVTTSTVDSEGGGLNEETPAGENDPQTTTTQEEAPTIANETYESGGDSEEDDIATSAVSETTGPMEPIEDEVLAESSVEESKVDPDDEDESTLPVGEIQEDVPPSDDDDTEAQDQENKAKDEVVENEGAKIDLSSTATDELETSQVAEDQSSTGNNEEEESPKDNEIIEVSSSEKDPVDSSPSDDTDVDAEEKEQGEQTAAGKLDTTAAPADAKEEDLAAKYASINSLEERAYTILVDLGMVGKKEESDSDI